MRYEKIAPGLSALAADYKKDGKKGLEKHIRSLGVVSRIENTPKPPRIVSFLYCEQNEKFDNGREQNLVVNQKKGKIRTAFFPLDSLDQVSEDTRIKRIIPAHYLKLKMDVACTNVGVPTFRNNTSLSGKGIIIGIVDSGIDPNHLEFSGRILKIWDQELHGPGVPEGPYGAELTGSLLSISRDIVGHGTHVAGIAGGKESKFGGVAPDAEYLIVKTDMMDAHISDGIRYIFRTAKEMSRPAVVNLSLGGHADAHDGTDPLSQIIDAECGPSKIVCCAAGNEGNDNIHAQKSIPKNSVRSIRFIVPEVLDRPRWIALNGWYSGSDNLAVSITSPSGFNTPFQTVISSGDPARIYDIIDGKITVSTPPPDPLNDDHNFFVFLEPHGLSSSPVDGTWKLLLRGDNVSNGRVDIWILDSSDSKVSIFTGTSVKDSVKIGSPGCSSQSITVASFTTKKKWTDIDSNNREIAFDLNSISDFSSEGPLRNEDQKPDITAPGAMICSALSADSTLDRGYMVSSKLRMMAGTSMATPFVSGIVALLLQRDKNLDPNEIKSLLKNNGHTPGKPQGTFDTKWGFGLIDMTDL
jgi:subtilisin family serine protease